MSRLAAKPCWEDMRRQLTFRCEDHEDLSNCPDSLVVYSENSGQFGIRVHDRGSSSIAIRHRPWCGATLVRRCIGVRMEMEGAKSRMFTRRICLLIYS